MPERPFFHPFRFSRRPRRGYRLGCYTAFLLVLSSFFGRSDGRSFAATCALSVGSARRRRQSWLRQFELRAGYLNECCRGRPTTTHLERLGILALKINPDPMLIATKAALWGSVKAHGFLPNTVIAAQVRPVPARSVSRVVAFGNGAFFLDSNPSRRNDHCPSPECCKPAVGEAKHDRPVPVAGAFPRERLPGRTHQPARGYSARKAAQRAIRESGPEPQTEREAAAVGWRNMWIALVIIGAILLLLRLRF